MNAHEFSQWLKAARPGSAVCYHLGHLAVDCGGENLPTQYQRDRRELRNAVHDAVEADQVCVTQRKLGHCEFEYLATRTRVPAHRSKIAA